MTILICYEYRFNLRHKLNGRTYVHIYGNKFKYIQINEVNSGDVSNFKFQISKLVSLIGCMLLAL